MVTELSDNNNVISKQKLTMTLCSKIRIDDHFTSVLDNLMVRVQSSIVNMLADRTKTSSKFFKDIPCVIAKSLIVKYQKNKKCKEVKNLVIPVSSDKGRVIKTIDCAIRIPVLFKKDWIKGLYFRQAPTQDGVKYVEFFKRKGQWWMSYVYNVQCNKEQDTRGVVGVDRNVRGNVAVTSNSQGVVRHFGPDVGAYKFNFRKKRANLQRKGKTGLCKKISKKQANWQKDVNHKVSRNIVNFAKEHSSLIVMEDLDPRGRGSKIKNFVEKNQWAYYQLQTFIEYKATLLGIPVEYVNPAFTTKDCSICGHRHQRVNGKKFLCEHCGHFDHRDANSAHNIRLRYEGRTEVQRLASVGHIGVPHKDRSFV